jgi:hypothetical protein
MTLSCTHLLSRCFPSNVCAGADATQQQALSAPVPRVAVSTTVGSSALSFKGVVKAVQTATRIERHQQSLHSPKLSAEAVVLFVNDARLFPELSLELIESIAQKAAVENSAATGIDATAFVLAIRAMAHEHSLAMQKKAAAAASSSSSRSGTSAAHRGAKSFSKTTAEAMRSNTTTTATTPLSPVAAAAAAAAAAASAPTAASYTTADELQAITAAVARLHALFEQYELPARVSSFKRGVAHITAPKTAAAAAVSRAVHSDAQT